MITIDLYPTAFVIIHINKCKISNVFPYFNVFFVIIQMQQILVVIRMICYSTIVISKCFLPGFIGT